MGREKGRKKGREGEEKAKERVLRMWRRDGRGLTAVTGEMGQLGGRHCTNERRNGIKNQTWWNWQMVTASSWTLCAQYHPAR